jgi:chromosomal replication initiation ATPase DnaA
MSNIREWVTGNPNEVNPDRIVWVISHVTNIDVSDILGTQRNPQVVRARHLLWASHRHILKTSYPALAKYYAVDKSSVQYAVQRVPADLIAEVEVLCTPHISKNNFGPPSGITNEV